MYLSILLMEKVSLFNTSSARFAAWTGNVLRVFALRLSGNESERDIASLSRGGSLRWIRTNLLYYSLSVSFLGIAAPPDLYPSSLEPGEERKLPRRRPHLRFPSLSLAAPFLCWVSEDERSKRSMVRHNHYLGLR